LHSFLYRPWADLLAFHFSLENYNELHPVSDFRLVYTLSLLKDWRKALRHTTKSNHNLRLKLIRPNELN
jgi:hypothetical protein